MSSIWQRISSWFGSAPQTGASEPEGESSDGGGATDLVAGLREATDGLPALNEELRQAVADRPEEDLTQARLLAASASVLKLIADGLTRDVMGGQLRALMGERWQPIHQRRAQHAGLLYREILALVEQARRAIVRPPPKLAPVKTPRVLARQPLPDQIEASDLLALNDELDRHYQDDIALARARRTGDEQSRLNELLGLLRSRSGTATAVLRQADPAASAGADQVFGRAVFNEVLALWLLIAQELVAPGITADLALEPVDRSGAPDPDNIWLMTDPVARARYEREGRLDQLEQDIRYEILRGRPFSPDDLAYARQIDWLEQTGVVKRRASYWATSPHTSIYRAKQAGRIRLTDQAVEFKKGDDIVWLCQMASETLGLEHCVLAGNLQSAAARRLCGTMNNAMMSARMGRMGDQQ